MSRSCKSLCDFASELNKPFVNEKLYKVEINLHKIIFLVFREYKVLVKLETISNQVVASSTVKSFHLNENDYILEFLNENKEKEHKILFHHLFQPEVFVQFDFVAVLVADDNYLHNLKFHCQVFFIC